MDETIIFYIVIAVFYLISRFLKGKPKEGEQSQPQSGPQRRPKTFEDILRELSGEEPVAEEEEYRPVPEKPRSREVIEEAEERAENRYEQMDDEIKGAYEKSVSEAKGLKTLDEMVDYNQPREKILKEEKVITKRSSGAAKIASMLKNKKDARKAIILSEIIQNKYI